jgi:hypothetical protein
MVDRASWSQVQGERETVHQISSGPNSLASAAGSTHKVTKPVQYTTTTVALPSAWPDTCNPGNQ